MLVSVDREAMIAGLKVVAPAVSARSTLPVLAHVKITVTADKILLSANKLDLTLETAVSPDTSTALPEVGVVLLPHKLLVDLLNEMSEEMVAFSSEPNSNKVEIRSGAGHLRLEGMPPEEFAITPIILTDQSIDVALEPEWFSAMCKHVTFSAATDDTRPTLTGVKVHVEEGQLEIATTDGFRLTRWQETVEWGDVMAIIPAGGLEAILSVMAPTQLTFNCQVMRFRSETTEAILRLIDGGYPDYTPIIAMDTVGCVLRAAKSELKQAVLLADVIARGDRNNHLAKLVWADGELQIGTQYSQWGENKSVCQAEIVAGQPTLFGINADYLGQAVGHVPGDVVEIVVPQDVGGPIHVRGAGDDRWLSVIMPIHLSRI